MRYGLGQSGRPNIQNSPSSFSRGHPAAVGKWGAFTLLPCTLEEQSHGTSLEVRALKENQEGQDLWNLGGREGLLEVLTLSLTS